MITDRPRYILQQANTGIIMDRDLEVQEPKFGKQLSGPGMLNFALMPKANPLYNWGKGRQLVHVEMEFDGVRRIVLSTIVSGANVDPKSGIMNIECKGFSSYPKGKPWLEDYNDIAVDPFYIVAKVWAHVQSFSNAQLNVEVYPQSSGTQMLPGFGFDGTTLVFDFFAIFIRSVDFVDCGDQIDSLARDIPFDYFEESAWNEDFTDIDKKIHLAYPYGGVNQEHLSFVQGENVLQMELAEERDIEPVTDVIIRGWEPGKVYSSRLGNVGTDQLRETIMEEDAKINSTERAKARARKKLIRRTVPKYWKKILIDPDHHNAPMGRWKEGDKIFVRGRDNWYGEIGLWHRITSWAYDPKARLVELQLKVEGAFNYDPIDYDPNYTETKPPNKLKNGYFSRNMAYWNRLAGAWIRVTSEGFESPGAVRIDLDDGYAALRSERVFSPPGEENSASAYVNWQGVSSNPGAGFVLRIIFYNNGIITSQLDIDQYDNPTGLHAWQRLEGGFTTPSDSNEFAVQLTATANVTDGVAFWDDVVVPGPP